MTEQPDPLADILRRLERVEQAVGLAEPPVVDPVTPVEPPVDPGEPPVTPPVRWWLDRGGPSLSGRSFRSGTFAVMGGALKSWSTYMGHPPECSGGNCRTYGPGGRADSWDKIVNLQADIANHPQTKDCVLGLNGLSKRTWLVLMFATVPLGAPLDELIAAANGKRADHHKRLGENFRRALDKAGRDPSLTIARPNWEFNQTTAFLIQAPGKHQNFILAGGSVAMYNDHMGHFARAFHDGFGYPMPLALSPAYQDSPGVEHVPYERWLAAGVYDLCCGSYHPNAERTKTQDEAWRMVFGLKTGSYTPAVVIEAAKKHQLPVAFLEHSCPPEAAACRPNIANAAFAFEQFGRLANRPESNVAFTCSLGSGMVAETRQKALGEPIASQWAEMVRTHRKHFGKRVA